MGMTDAERARVAEIRAKREDVEQRADDCVQRWGEAHKRHASDGAYNQDTGVWAYKEPHRVTAAMYALDAYRDAGKMVGDLAQLVDDALSIIDRLAGEPEVVRSEWVNIQPCTKDAVEYADFIAYLARTEMSMASWECKECGSIDMGAPNCKPDHCRGCGATMTNGDCDERRKARRKERDDG